MVQHTCIYCDLLTSLVSLDSSDQRGTASILVNHAIRHLGVPAADVLIFDNQSQRLISIAASGFRGAGREKAVYRLEDTPAGRAVAEKSIVRIGDISRARDAFQRMKGIESEDMTTYLGMPLVVNDAVQGVLELWSRQRLNPNDAWLSALDQIAEKGAIALENVMRVRKLARANIELAQGGDTMIEAWSRSLEMRNYEAKGHAMLVADTTVDLARALKVAKSEMPHIRRGALLHDVGMIGIPDSILLKSESLSEEELTIVRRHPMIAYELLSPVEFLKPALDIPRYHHEKWDGTGYPYGLKGEEIPFAARVFALVDVWDALGSDRPARKGWPENKVKQHIHDRGGKQFDPDLADRFLKLLETAKRRQPGSVQGQSHSYDLKAFDV